MGTDAVSYLGRPPRPEPGLAEPEVPTGDIQISFHRALCALEAALVAATVSSPSIIWGGQAAHSVASRHPRQLGLWVAFFNTVNNQNLIVKRSWPLPLKGHRCPFPL